MSTLWRALPLCVAAALAVVFASPVRAQAPRPPAPAAAGAPAAAPAARSTPPVVVIDIGKVFEQHIRFKQEMELLKKDAEAFDTFLRNEQTRLTALAESRKQFEPASQEAKQIEEQLARDTSELQVQMQLKRKELLEREAKVMFKYYAEVSAAVAAFADAHGISLVLRFNSEAIDKDDRVSILQGVNNAIVFQRNLDITAHIIGEVNKGVAPTDDPRVSGVPGRQPPR